MICCARWLWVSLPSATFALGISGDRVAEAPPYARRMRLVGMSEAQAVAMLRQIGAAVQLLPDAPGSWTCPQCGMTTRDPDDVLIGFCVRCDGFTGCRVLP